MAVQVTRHEEFEMSHLLPGYDGGCKNLHGHTYKIEVTVEGPQNKGWGMVVDFKDLKKAIKMAVPDHRFVAYKNDNISMDIIDVLDKYKIDYIIYDFETTAENMVSFFAAVIDGILKHEMGYFDVDVVEVKLWETTNSFATWRKA